MRKNHSSPTAATASGVHSRPANPVRRILVVDDDPIFRHRNTEVLIRHGCKVNAAGDGGAGWEELQTNQYHLVITESELPSLTGTEPVRQLLSARLAVPVIMATEKLPSRAAQALRLHPMVAPLKPCTVEEFLDAARLVLGATQIENENLARPNRQPHQPVNGLWL